MALLLRPSPPPPHLRRLFSAASSRLLPLPSPAASARLLFNPRVVAAAVPPRNGVAVRAFMASTAASEAMQEKRVAGEYTAANVQALEVTVWRDGKEYQQSYSRGKALTTLTSITLPGESSSRQGTHIRFWPDKDIFTTTIDFDFNTISSRIRKLAFLNLELTITLTKEEDHAQVQHNEYCYAGGLVEYVKWLNTDKKPLHDPIAFRKELDGIMVDVSLQWFG